MPPRLKTIIEALEPLGIVFFTLFGVYLLLRYAAPTSGFTLLVLLALYVVAIILGIRLLRRNLNRILWSLRNRLFVAYLFIAVVPVALVLLLVAIGGYILTGQVAVYLVGSELDRRIAMLNGAAQLVVNANVRQREPVARETVALIQGRLPALAIVASPGKVRYPVDTDLAPPPAAWKDASGLVMKDSQLCGWAHVLRPDSEVTIVAPITQDWLADLAPGIGQVFLGSLDAPSKSPRKAQVRDPRSRHVNRIPPPANAFDISVSWLTRLSVPLWESPGQPVECVLLVGTRPSAVLSAVFGHVEFSQNVAVAFVIVAGILFIVELFSLRIGVTLTRTITRAVHNLYQGTQRVKEGDFSHRIAVKGGDQLAELARSFNGMTENLERLILVEKEQVRLKSEIEIAREVQGQLFPRGAPAMKTLELTGVCHPARMVSGDYYDFVRLQDSRVAVAIGDVAGKGISAALLMAAIQSIMRTQLTAGIAVPAAAGQSGSNGGAHSSFSTAGLVAQLNRQVYATTAPEKYATFYFGIYDDENRQLTYTNAGHLPPIRMRDGMAQRLDVTGTVVGAFPSVPYQEKTIDLRRGDLLVAFTDGIVEPENEYGEAFGEERLIDLLVRYGEREAKEIIARIMETVEQWTGASELFDDMTLLVARSV